MIIKSYLVSDIKNLKEILKEFSHSQSVMVYILDSVWKKNIILSEPIICPSKLKQVNNYFFVYCPAPGF